MILMELLWLILIAVISAIPLNIAAKMLGGDSSILKVIFINVAFGIISGLLYLYLGIFAPLIAFIVMLFIYQAVFSVGLLRAFFIWILQFIIIAILKFHNDKLIN